MNTVQLGIVALLKSAVTEKAQPLPDGFSVEQALPYIKAHQIATTIYEGALLCGVDPGEPAMQRLFQQYCKSLQVSARQMREIERVISAFESNGIDYMPLKGCKLKALYPRPELRSMGDADILIRMEQYEKIVPIMKELGFCEGHESDHELAWQSDGLHLELHKRLIPSYNQDFYAYFAEGWHLANRQSGTCYAMSAEEEMIFLFTHFAKHYRDGGIGCRYVMDLWLFLRANPEMNEDYIHEQLQKLHLLEFYQNVRQLIRVWFEGAPSDEKTDFISDFILASGSWGTKENKLLSRTAHTRKDVNPHLNGKLAYLWRIAFPNAYALSKKYPIVKKHPYMVPLVWLWRPFYKLLFDNGNLHEKREEMELVSSERLDERMQALHYVGLDWNS